MDTQNKIQNPGGINSIGWSLGSGRGSGIEVDWHDNEKTQ
jgi:hypothetical protein